MYSDSIFSHSVLIPIEKSMKQNQIHKDYPFALSATGYLIASSGSQTTRVVEKHAPLSFSSQAKKMNCIQKALSERAFYQPEKIFYPENNSLFYSKKPRIVEFTPYTSKDYTTISKPINLGGLGPSNIGSKAWEEGIRRKDRMRSYADKVRNSGKNSL